MNTVTIKQRYGNHKITNEEIVLWEVYVTTSNRDNTIESFQTELEACEYAEDVKNRPLRPFAMFTSSTEHR